MINAFVSWLGENSLAKKVATDLAAVASHWNVNFSIRTKINSIQLTQVAEKIERDDIVKVIVSIIHVITFLLPGWLDSWKVLWVISW